MSTSADLLCNIVGVVMGIVCSYIRTSYIGTEGKGAEQNSADDGH